MKPGDLVVGNEEGHLRFGYKTTPSIGILLGINRTFTNEFLQEIIWWDVLRDDGIIVQEVSHALEVIA